VSELFTRNASAIAPPPPSLKPGLQKLSMRNTITLHHAFKSLNLSNSPLPELNFVPRHDNRIYFSIFYGRAHLLRCSVQHNVPVRGHHLVEHLLWEQFESILELHPGMSVVLHLLFLRESENIKV
jgi:hypothetical protein